MSQQFIPGFPVNNQGNNNVKLWPLFTAIIIVGLFGVFAFLYSGDILPAKNQEANIGNTIKTESYQAVFLTSGQVYFGKLSFRDDWAVLSDVYYLQADQNLQQTQNNSNFQLVKLGSEIHGPEDVMYIEKGKVLFWENMKSDSQVLQAIQKYRK